MTVKGENRHTRAHPCRVCKGCDEADRGKGKRCSGYDSEDGAFIRCSREEYAGSIEADTYGLYRHIARGECDCGTTHGAILREVKKPIAVYPYRDAKGQLLCEVTRWEGKRFSQRRPIGDGWKNDTEGVPWTLYRLERFAKLSKDQTVYLVEGERDVETAEGLRVFATTNRGGAGKAHLCDWTPLAGRTVHIIADRDDEHAKYAGQKHAAAVAEILRGLGCTVYGPDHVAKGKDLSDAGTLAGLVPMGAVPVPAPKATPEPSQRVIAPAAPASDAEVPWGDDEPPKNDDGLPEIVYGTDIHRVVDELERCMARLDPGLYQRGRALVTVLGSDGQRGVADGTPVIRELTQAALLPRITQHVQLVKKKAPPIAERRVAEATGQKAEFRSEKMYPPGPTVIQPLLARGEWPNIRLLKGIAETPLLRADGTVLQTAGYDPATGYLFSPNALYLTVDPNPSQSEARAALRELRELFVHFPFTSDAGSCVAIAALLTIMSRPAVPRVPVFAFEASVRGSGKTLQCEVVHLIATGRPAAVGDWPSNDEEEQKKTLNAIALSAPQVVVFDNIKGLFGGSTLEGMLTTERVTFRGLGGKDVYDIPWTGVLMASGNNMQPTDDMIRRTLISRLEPQESDPTTRTGLPDLHAIVRERRPHLVRAAMTILRSFCSHGRPDAGARMASFDPWAQLVANAIIYAGGPNVTEARRRDGAGISDDVTAAATVVAMLPELLRTVGGTGITTKAMLTALYVKRNRDDPPDGFDDLREALEVIAPMRGGQPDAQLLGRRLRGHIGRWFGDARLKPDLDEHTKVTRWTVERRA